MSVASHSGRGRILQMGAQAIKVVTFEVALGGHRIGVGPGQLSLESTDCGLTNAFTRLHFFSYHKTWSGSLELDEALFQEIKIRASHVH